jgi:hypothetical protein
MNRTSYQSILLFIAVTQNINIRAESIPGIAPIGYNFKNTYLISFPIFNRLIFLRINFKVCSCTNPAVLKKFYFVLNNKRTFGKNSQNSYRGAPC